MHLTSDHIQLSAVLQLELFFFSFSTETETLAYLRRFLNLFSCLTCLQLSKEKKSLKYSIFNKYYYKKPSPLFGLHRDMDYM